jgi:hypothetical protein
MPHSLDTDNLTIRKVNALTPTNSFIPALTTLTSDGQGGTYWAVPATLGGIPAINEVVVDNKKITASNAFNTFAISSLRGVGTIVDPATNIVSLYAKCFDTFDISGGNSISAFSNSIVSPTMKLVGRNGVKITGDPFTRTLFFDTPATAISTGIYGYSQLNFISNASTLNIDAINNSNNTLLTAGSTSSLINFVGVGDIVLNTNSTSNAVFMSISSFSSADYLNNSTLINNMYASTLSTVSSLFIANTSPSGNPTMNALLSTSSGLQSNIQFNADNVMNNYTNIDLFKILSNTVDKVVSYSSSITTTDFIGTYTGTVGIDQHITVSTIQFRLDSMSSFINGGAQVKLSYSPSLKYNFVATAADIANVSTFIKAGNDYIYDATFVRPWFIQAINSPAAQPYLYTDTMNFILDSSNINSLLNSTFTLYHHVDLSAVSYPGGLTNTINVLTCAHNSFNITLTGMN